MQSLASLVFLVLTTMMLMVQWILPMLNLHIALSQETLLSERAQRIVDAGRLSAANTASDLQELIINGININQVSQELRGDYIIYQLQFSHRGLFTNKFLSKTDLEKPKLITLISDRV
jgi:hypothetical protein